jgi:hypothetical protein
MFGAGACPVPDPPEFGANRRPELGVAPRKDYKG